MLDNVSLPNVLFLDIETVPCQPHYEDLTEKLQKLWTYRTSRFNTENIVEEDYFFEKAGVYAEFGKIVCISVGFLHFNPTNKEFTLRIKSFYGEEEKELLGEFLELLAKHFNNPYKYFLCGHNIKGFDIPFLCRRAIINDLPLPRILDVNNFKPWEVPYIDTMQLWKFGEYRNFTSLDLLTTSLNIPSPKNDLEGAEVGDIYWSTKDVERIKRYCERDVVAIVQLLLRFKRLPLLSAMQIISV